MLTGRLCVWGQVVGVGSRADRKNQWGEKRMENISYPGIGKQTGRREKLQP